jgi:hypothetical protein
MFLSLQCERRRHYPLDRKRGWKNDKKMACKNLLWTGLLSSTG